MKTNLKVKFKETTHEGAPAARINAEAQLRRSVLSCLLWEANFYESGQSIGERICSLVPTVRAETVAAIAVEAREKMKLRHVPLLLCREMAKHPTHKPFVAETLARVIQRADELCEFLSLYSEGRTGTKKLNKLSNQARKGLAAAFGKFNAYALAKYNQANAIKLRDVLFLCHAKPKDAEQDAIWKKLIAGTLESPDTWEVELSASKDKKASWTRLLTEDTQFQGSGR
jgi:60 kDa SS-A/Ro ribonucleoprotein